MKEKAKMKDERSKMNWLLIIRMESSVVRSRIILLAKRLVFLGSKAVNNSPAGLDGKKILNNCPKQVIVPHSKK